MALEVIYADGHAWLPGLAYWVIGPSVAALAILATALRRLRAQPTSSLGRELVSIRNAEKLLLSAGYLFASLSWLNVMTAAPNAWYSAIISVSIAFANTVLIVMLLITLWPDPNNPGAKELRLQTVTAIYLWVLCMFGGGAATFGLAHASYRIHAESGQTPLDLTPPQLALLWTAFCSFFFGAVLFRPKKMHVLSKTGLLVALGTLIVLAFSAALEYISRKNWYLYTLSSVSFVGIVVGVWRVWLCLRPAPDAPVSAGGPFLAVR